MYKYIKSNREYVYNKDIPQSFCLCKISENVCFVAKVLNNSFSIFTACCYTRGIDGTLFNKNFTVTSEATDHSRIVAFSCINLIIDFLHNSTITLCFIYGVIVGHHNFGPDLFLHWWPTLIQIALFIGTITRVTTRMALWTV